MIEIKGKYNSAKVFTDSLEKESRLQIENLCNQSFIEGSKIRMMPDVHAGAGCTIGTSLTVTDKIIPNIVGVDIGCGLEVAMIKSDRKQAKSFDPVKLDKIIYKHVPSGMDLRDEEHEFVNEIPLQNIRCPEINRTRARKSIGSLGGGNHFIEANRDEEDNLYIVIHSGSRHLGKEIAEYYQNEAWNQLNKNRGEDIAELIAGLKSEGRYREIQKRIQEVKKQVLTDIPKDLAYITGSLFDDYINDMKIVQYFALLNRKAMMNVILKKLKIPEDAIDEQFTTIHNYIDTESMILRKGSVSAKRNEKLIIPINMRDGSLICEGLGNPDWNYSAPHGAGRLMSRSSAFKNLKMEDFKKTMTGIYSTSVREETIDESPMAYKDMSEIINNTKPTVRIIKTIKPIYNFKAAETIPSWKKKK
ncbi:MAG: RtcB family protein [Tannerella sp.]|jgi:RNA-splicing ligase RtcB|nr:RtcB family protein [Tannerella sp.]